MILSGNFTCTTLNAGHPVLVQPHRSHPEIGANVSEHTGRVGVVLLGGGDDGRLDAGMALALQRDLAPGALCYDDRGINVYVRGVRSLHAGRTHHDSGCKERSEQRGGHDSELLDGAHFTRMHRLDCGAVIDSLRESRDIPDVGEQIRVNEHDVAGFDRAHAEVGSRLDGRRNLLPPVGLHRPCRQAEVVQADRAVDPGPRGPIRVNSFCYFNDHFRGGEALQLPSYGFP